MQLFAIATPLLFWILQYATAIRYSLLPLTSVIDFSVLYWYSTDLKSITELKKTIFSPQVFVIFQFVRMLMLFITGIKLYNFISQERFC
jgi:hypothetical protein